MKSYISDVDLAKNIFECRPHEIQNPGDLLVHIHNYVGYHSLDLVKSEQNNKKGILVISQSVSQKYRQHRSFRWKQ